jgi:tetratricopeptide (TPR) repeat protein
MKSGEAYHLDFKEALDKLGKYQEAIKCCDKALEIDPNYACKKTNLLNYLDEQKKEKKKGWFR